MAKVVYGVCGEGLGHATRVMTIVRQLLNQHEFRIFAARDAFHYLSKHLPKHENVQLLEIPGLHFQYTGNRISYARSLTCSIGYAWKMDRRVNQMRDALGDFNCDLAITAFEPLTARLARKQNVPLVSIDHQHFINCLDYEAASLVAI